MYQKKEKSRVRQSVSKATAKLFRATRAKRAKMGMGTLEVVIIIAALLTLALFFSSQIKDFAGTVADSAFQEQNVLAELGKTVP